MSRARPGILSRVADGIVGIVSPRAAARRSAWRARTAINHELQSLARHYARRAFSGGYRGANSDRLRAKWVPGSDSADGALLDDLPTLRDRSRDLNRNNGYAAGVTTTMTTNVVGTGAPPPAKIDVAGLKARGITLSDDRVAEIQATLERGWRRWTGSPFCDSRNRMTFLEVETLIERSMLESGDVIVLPLMLDRRGPPRRPYSLALEVLEADRLDTPPGRTASKSVRSGVELGDRGEPVAYWVRSSHPGDNGRYVKDNDYTRIEAWNKWGRPQVLHLYHALRPGQTRGLPLFAPVMEFIRNLGEYMEAEEYAKRLEACIGLIIQSADAYEMAAAQATDTDSASKAVQEFEPGMVWHLQPGQEAKAFESQRPGNTFEPFTRLILRAISTGLGLPYELVAKDFSESNYSNMRAALLEARRLIRNRRHVRTAQFPPPVW